MIYDVDFFINKFSAIPEEKWCVLAQKNDIGQHCAIGHCGNIFYKGDNGFYSGNGHTTVEGMALMFVFNPLKLVAGAPVVATINNGSDPRYPQPTPKQRILAALHDIKKLTEPKKERVVYVAVPVSITEQVKELITN